MNTKPCGFGLHIRANGVSPLKPQRPTDAGSRLVRASEDGDASEQKQR